MVANLGVVRSSNFAEKPEVRRNPGRKSDAAYGRDDHKYLTPEQVKALAKAAEAGRHGKRDSCMILLAFDHGLRVSELVGLKWTQVDLEQRELHVIRKKGGRNKRQTIKSDCYRRLKKLREAREPGAEFVFMNERGRPLSTDAFASQLKAAGERAHIDPRLVHPHALRHACGAEMARRGVEGYEIAAHMGHRKLETTNIYLDGVAGQDSWSKPR
jgi:integrase